MKRDGELLISGDSSGALCVWRDHTLEATQEALAATQRVMGAKQEMENHIKVRYVLFMSRLCVSFFKVCVLVGSNQICNEFTERRICSCADYCAVD